MKYLSFSVRPVGIVSSSRKVPLDDFWGDVQAVIELDPEQYGTEALSGLDQFSHLEVIYQFHLVSVEKILNGASYPRGNPLWPKCGIFSQRKKDRPNKLGVSVCKIEKVNGLKVYVVGLDAIDGTPVLDLKPVIREFLPDQMQIRQPAWATELMTDYFKVETERS